jgi:hypothetical protein
MPSFAGIRTCVLGGHTIASKNVLPQRHRFKMFWIDATTVSAKVIDGHAIRYYTIVYLK